MRKIIINAKSDRKVLHQIVNFVLTVGDEAKSIKKPHRAKNEKNRKTTREKAQK